MTMQEVLANGTNNAVTTVTGDGGVLTEDALRDMMNIHVRNTVDTARTPRGMNGAIGGGGGSPAENFYPMPRTDTRRMAGIRDVIRERPMPQEWRISEEDISETTEQLSYNVQIADAEYLLHAADSPDAFYSAYMVYKFPKEAIGQTVSYSGNKYVITGIEKREGIYDTYVIIKKGLLSTQRIRPFDIRFVKQIKSFNAEESMREVALNLLRGRLIRIAHYGLDRLVREINEMSEKISYLNSSMDRDSAKLIEKQSKILKKQIISEQSKVTDLTMIDLLSEIKKIKEHPSVEKVWINKEATLFIQTKQLFISKWDEEKPTDQVLGEMLFRIPLGDENGLYIQAVNLTHQARGYFHSQISGTEICLDAERKTLKNFLNSSELFAFVDYLIMFISTPFQKDSTYYLNPDVWVASREAIETNPERAFSDWRYKKWEMN